MKRKSESPTPGYLLISLFFSVLFLIITVVYLSSEAVSLGTWNRIEEWLFTMNYSGNKGGLNNFTGLLLICGVQLFIFFRLIIEVILSGRKRK